MSKDTSKLQEILIEHARSKPSADVYYRNDWECFYFSLLGKCFGRVDEASLTLKGDPEENVLLRNQYSDVTPGYYANKVHWNSIKLDTDQLTLTELKQMIDLSYKLVFDKLTKKEKLTVENDYVNNTGKTDK